jgi:hypothetical protein
MHLAPIHLDNDTGFLERKKPNATHQVLPEAGAQRAVG